MKIFYLLLLLYVIFSKDIQCEELQVTTTPDNPGNVIEYGKYNEKWSNSQYVSYANAEKVRFFLSGLPSNSTFKLSHSCESRVLDEKWLYAELSSQFISKESTWILEVVQECLPRDSWRTINLTLNIDQCRLPINWFRNCGNPTRVLGSFNLGFGKYNSELIKYGIVNAEFNSLAAGKIKSQNATQEIYFWSSFKDYIFLDINLTYSITNRADESKKSISQFKQVQNNTQVFQINQSCSEPGTKKVHLTVELVNLQTFSLAYSYTCASSSSASHLFFKILAIVVIIILILLSLVVLYLRFKDSPSLFRISSAFSSKSGSSYLPDKEFPDIQFSDLTFRSDSQAYGTV